MLLNLHRLSCLSHWMLILTFEIVKFHFRGLHEMQCHICYYPSFSFRLYRCHTIYPNTGLKTCWIWEFWDDIKKIEIDKNFMIRSTYQFIIFLWLLLEMCIANLYLTYYFFNQIFQKACIPSEEFELTVNSLGAHIKTYGKLAQAPVVQ